MVIGSGEHTIIDLRIKTEECLDAAYTRGKTETDLAGSIILSDGSFEIVRERTGILWLSGVLIEEILVGEATGRRWNFEFLPNNGVDVVRDGDEIIDLRECTQAAGEMLELIQNRDSGKAA